MGEFKIVRIFGVDILFHWTLLALVGLLTWGWAGDFGWLWAFAAAVIFIFCIIFHEMAHALAGRKLGISVKKISLFLFGGGAYLDGENFLRFYRPKMEFLMTIAGPLSSLLLAGIFYAISYADFLGDSLTSIFGFLFVLNLIVTAFNVIPIFPLDGGRILRCALCAITKNLARATKIAVVITTILGTLLFILSYALFGAFSGIWIGFIVFFFLIPAASAEYRAVQRLP